MAKDDMRKILYIILTELYESKKNGKRIDLDIINPERFKINESYWLDIIEEASSHGWIKGIMIKQTKTGRIVSGMEDMEITFDGVTYLSENSTMKKVYEALKEVKDWTSIF